MGNCCAHRDLSVGPHKFSYKPTSEGPSSKHASDDTLERTADETLGVCHTRLESQEQSSDHLEFYSPENNSLTEFQDPSRSTKTSSQVYIESNKTKNSLTSQYDLRIAQFRSLHPHRNSADASYYNLPTAGRISAMKPQELKDRISVPILITEKKTQNSEETSEWAVWIRNLRIDEIVDLLYDSTHITGTALSIGWSRKIYSKRTLALGRIAEMLRKGKIDMETIVELEIIERIFSFIEEDDEELRFWTDVFIMHLLKAYRFTYISITEDQLLLFNFADMLSSPDEQMRCVTSKILRYLLKASSDSRLKIEDYEESIFPKSLYKITHTFTQPKYLHSHLVTIRLLMSNPNYSFMNLYSQENSTEDFLNTLKKDIETMKSHDQFLRYEYRINKIYQGILEDVKEYQYMKHHSGPLSVSSKYLRSQTSVEPLRAEFQSSIHSDLDFSVFNESDEALKILDNISSILENSEPLMISKQISNSDTLDSENIEMSMN